MQQRVESKSSNIGIGAVTAAAGGYFILVSLGVLPPPGPKNPHDPMWIVFCAGLAFLLGGIAVITRAFAGDVPPDGELPPTAPRWVRMTQYVVALVAMGCLAAIGTWIAFAGDPRKFSTNIPFLDGSHVGVSIVRTMFGIGAIVTWLGLIAMAKSGARKLFGRDRA